MRGARKRASQLRVILRCREAFGEGCLLDLLDEYGDVHVAGAVGDVDGAEHEGFVEGEDGGAVEDGLAHDRFGDAGDGDGLVQAGVLNLDFRRTPLPVTEMVVSKFMPTSR